MPFTDLSPDGDQSYFCDGVVEEIINMLARVDGLDVASRWSTQRYRDGSSSVQEVGSELNVARVLEGTVRKSGDRLRITAQLVDTGNGYLGGLQFSQVSWEEVGGTGSPAAASREEQIMRGEFLFDLQGWGAWPRCSAQLGLE